MPPDVNEVPQHKWAWELKARMEEAHSAVRYHTGQEMRRQKRYHDAKVHWQRFAKNDKVYVLFPKRKVDHSSKFTSYWRGPYTIVGKKSDLLYEVDCGYRGKLQVIHADRLKLHKSQVLADEEVDADLKADDDELYQDPMGTNRIGKAISRVFAQRISEHGDHQSGCKTMLDISQLS